LLDAVIMDWFIPFIISSIVVFLVILFAYLRFSDQRRREAERYANILKTAMDGLWLVREDGSIGDVN
jgi:PAS domain-containing protein